MVTILFVKFLVIFLTAVVTLSLSYRGPRGGGYNVGGTTIGRIVWGASLGLICSILMPVWMMMSNDGAVQALWLTAQVGYISISGWLGMVLVGHSAYQGLWRADPRRTNGEGKEHEWIGRWLPGYSAERPLWKNVAIASVGLALVGAFRAFLLLAPLLAFNYVLVVVGVLVSSLTHPIAYLAGEFGGFMPRQLTAYQDKNGEYGIVHDDRGANSEALCGLGYAIMIGSVAFTWYGQNLSMMMRF